MAVKNLNFLINLFAGNYASCIKENNYKGKYYMHFSNPNGKISLNENKLRSVFQKRTPFGELEYLGKILDKHIWMEKHKTKLIFRKSTISGKEHALTSNDIFIWDFPDKSTLSDIAKIIELFHLSHQYKH